MSPKLEKRLSRLLFERAAKGPVEKHYRRAINRDARRAHS
jgi:hypothetical protein